MIAGFRARPVIAMLVLTAAVAAVAAIGLGERHTPGPEIELTRGSNELQIRNWRRGRAVVKGSNLAPGDRRLGRVTVAVISPARMTLATDHLRRMPGPNGGVLARELTLKIRMSAGHGRGHAMVYDGPLTDLAKLRLGRWRSGERHRFRVRVSFPAEAGSQDSLQGARTGLRLVWRASR